MAAQLSLSPTALGHSASSPCLSRPSSRCSSQGLARSPAGTTGLMSPLASAGRVAVTNMGLPGETRGPQGKYDRSNTAYGSFYHDPQHAHKLVVQRMAKTRDFTDHMRATGMFRNRSFKTLSDQPSRVTDLGAKRAHGAGAACASRSLFGEARLTIRVPRGGAFMAAPAAWLHPVAGATVVSSACMAISLSFSTCSYSFVSRSVNMLSSHVIWKLGLYSPSFLAPVPFWFWPLGAVMPSIFARAAVACCLTRNGAEKAREDVERARLRVRELQAQGAAAQEKQRQHELQISVLTSEKEAAEGRVRALVEDAEASLARADRAETQLQAAEYKVRALVEEAEANMARADRAESDLEEEEKEKEEEEESMWSATGQRPPNQAAESKVRALVEETEASMARADRAESELEAAQLRLEELEAMAVPLQAAESRVRSLLEEAGANLARADRAERELEAARMRVAELEAAAAPLEARAASLSSLLAGIGCTVGAALKDTEAADDGLTLFEAAVREKEALEARAQQLEQEVDQAQAVVGDLTERVSLAEGRARLLAAAEARAEALAAGLRQISERSGAGGRAGLLGSLFGRSEEEMLQDTLAQIEDLQAGRR
ncbi:unnamed protein product [Prorocentrum cordatum]|uniref:Uncharacterized protein n=1 Tax=Prorocentrum cordatum TaxID=2364126 RepID=A0ABN9RXF6_9DINO|nr:unnamed protein product [Polarella glacialis]